MRLVHFFCGFCYLLLVPMVHAQQVSRLPYVQMTTEDSAAVLWRTVGGTVPIVRYGPVPGVYTGEVLPVGMVIRLGPDVQGPAGSPRLHSAPPGTFQYEASIFGLMPGTTYYYSVFDGDQLLAGGDAVHRFTTLPQTHSETSLRLWITGDTGEGSEAQIAAFDAMRSYVAADGRPVDAYLHLGDMAYESGYDEEFSDHFFDIYTELLRNTVVWPTMGNHEGITSSGVTQTGPYYDSFAVPTQAEAGGVASGTEAYYSFDIGRAHFICLDSHDLDRSPTAEMALWLKSDLEMAYGDWIIAFWHHPPYTKGTHDSDFETELIEMREFIMPILESGGVDLVLSGHSHIYERSMLIDGAYATPTTAVGVVLDDGDGDPDGNGAYLKTGLLTPNEGTVAVVAGHGEGAGRAFAVNPVMRSVVGDVGSVIVDIDNDVLTGTMIDVEGAVRDRFQLIKRGVVEQQIVEHPWQPVGPSFVTERLEPGLMRVEIAPVPAVADAVLRFESNGSEADLGSGIYTGPVSIGDRGEVSAFSTWQDGERRSLTASSPEVPAEFSIHRYPASAEDDGVEDSLGNVSLDGETILIGDDGIAGLRFTDVRIPRGAHIVGAQIQFWKAETRRMSTSGSIQAELSADSAAFTADAFGFSSRPKLVTEVPWTVRTWSGPALRDLNTLTPDLGELVGELTAQAGWQPGNAMSFFFSHTGEGRVGGAFDGGKGTAATLSVIYIDPDGLAESLAAVAPRVERIQNGRYAVISRWPHEAIASELGLSFELQASRDLKTWATVAPRDAYMADLKKDGFGELHVEVPVVVTNGRPRVYFRLLISSG